MKLLLIICFFILNLTLGFGQEINSELQLISPPAILKEGEVVEGVLKVWPIENADLNEFRNIENTYLLNALYVANIENIEVSPNNADVVEVKLLLVVKRSTSGTQLPFNYKGHIISIHSDELKLAPQDKDQNDYFILDQGSGQSGLWKFLLATVIALFLLYYFYKKGTFDKFFSKMKNDPLKKRRLIYKTLFAKASTRIDYEEIYAKKNDWYELIIEKAPAYLDFFKTMELHQYKKTWAENEFEEVKDSFNVISRSFE